MTKSGAVFYWAFRSPCTIFALNGLQIGNVKIKQVLFVIPLVMH